MGKLAIGTVLVINFPSADMKSFKKRPAVVVAQSPLDTVVFCQITSRRVDGTPAVELMLSDFDEGELPLTSYIRPDKLFTVDTAVAKQRQLGMISDIKLQETKEKIQNLFA